MRLEFEARRRASALMVFASPVLAVLLTLVCVVGILFATGRPILESLHALFVAPISDSYGLSELFVKATPLVLCGVGLAIGFRAGVWNIGAEGQLLLGGVFAGGLAIHVHSANAGWFVPLVLCMGVLGGMAWAAIPAWLKTRFNANEILTSLMLTYVASLLLSYLVHGPWRDPDGFNFPESRLFDDFALLPVILQGTRLHLGAPLALALALLGWLVFARTLVGFQLKVAGLAPSAALYAGISSTRTVWFCLLLGGGLAGLAGAIEVSGPIGQLVPTISPGYGFTAIIVAFLGRLHPLGVLFAGHLMALSYLGGEAGQMSLGLPGAVTGVFQGMLLFFLLACDVLISYRVRFVRKLRSADGGSSAQAFGE